MSQKTGREEQRHNTRIALLTAHIRRLRFSISDLEEKERQGRISWVDRDLRLPEKRLKLEKLIAEYAREAE